MFDKIVGKRFNRISRCIDMLCIWVAENIMVKFNHKEEECERAEFAFHIQTQWRFVKNDTLLLGSRDIYIPFCDNVPDDWEYDIVDRSREESSVFDVKKHDLEKLLENQFVTGYEMSKLGDLKIMFSDGTYFELFIPTSVKDEEWRFIDFKQDIHIAVFND